MIFRKVSAGGALPSRVKNASNIVQHEWFKVSSTAQADPHSVEFYLDQFEHHSGSLLGHVVNLMDSSGNTAMHYAVSHGNFDVVSILIDSKVCDVNRSNNAGYTPVMLAALAQVRNSTHASVVKRLFQIADVNVRARLVSTFFRVLPCCIQAF
jgi:ankyrin repeat protein